MNFDSFALSKFDPAKAAYSGPFPGPSGISIVSLAIFVRVSLLRRSRHRPRTPRPCRTGPVGRLLGIGWTMHRATDAGLYLKPPCSSITIVHADDRSACRQGRVLLLRLFALQKGVPIAGRRRRHTKACAAQADCWQCCHCPPPLVRDLDSVTSHYVVSGAGLRRFSQRHSQPPNGGSRQTPATRIAMAAPMQFQPLRLPTTHS